MERDTYKVVKNPLGTYYFSFAYCHATEIVAYFFGVFLGIIIYLIFREDLKKPFMSDIIEFVAGEMALSVPFLFIGIYMTVKTRSVKKIMTLGDVVGGEVRSYERIHVNYGGGVSGSPNTTVLNIKFHYNGLQFCSVRVGHKMPHKALASHKCKVYIYGNRVFVTGFELRKRGMPEITFERKRY